MAIKSSSFLFLLLLFISSSLLCLASHEPTTELDLCVKRCHKDEEGILECTTRCEQEALEPTNTEDPRRLYELCQKRCDRQERDPTKRKECKSECRTEYERQRHRWEEHNPEMRGVEEEEEERSGAESHPYHFSPSSFRFRFRSKDGNLRVLPKFTERARRLFRGIENYRFGFMEAEPNTFTVPHHCDADAVFVVVRGRGTVTFVSQKTRDSFNIEQGHVVRVPAGTTLYLTNTDNHRRLRLAKIYVPINTPGHFEEYYAAGAANQQSYFRGFSSEVLEASLNAPREQIEKVLGQQQVQQKQGIIRKASPEQLKELSRHATSPFGHKRRGQRRWTPFNLQSERPTYSNRYGQFYEAKPDNFEQLEDLGISVSFTNMTQWSIFAPHYNSKATTIVFAVDGNGHIEMACPHVSPQQWQQRQRWHGRGEREEEEEEEEGEQHKGQIHKIRSDISEGDVFIIPAGHPVALVSQDNNLVTVGFGINAENSRRNFLAGQENIMNQVEKEAKQLAFGTEGEQVERLFKSQEESYFVPARRSQRRSQGREAKDSFQSILNFVGY